MEQNISEIISIPIIPVILLPVTGLISLVFYNRSAGIHQRIRLMQKELRDLHLQEKAKPNERLEEMIGVLQKEMQFLHKRAKFITRSLISCLLAICLFSLCAFCVALSIFFPQALQVGLVFWFIGPVLICYGVINGILELVQSSFTLPMQSRLIEKWSQEGPENIL